MVSEMVESMFCSSPTSPIYPTLGLRFSNTHHFQRKLIRDIIRQQKTKRNRHKVFIA